MRVALIPAVLALLALAAPASAAPPAPAAPPEAPAFLDENLLVAMPAEWAPVLTNDDPTLRRKHIEFAPQGETAQNWTNKITLQILHDVTISAQIFISAYKERFEQSQACDDPAFNVLAIGKLSGFDAVLADMACPRHRRLDRGEYGLIQAIRGKDALYVIHRARRAPPFAKGQTPMTQEEHQDWLRFMKAAAICDTRDPTHPCPGQAPAKKPEKKTEKKPAKPNEENPGEAKPEAKPAPAAAGDETPKPTEEKPRPPKPAKEKLAKDKPTPPKPAEDKPAQPKPAE